MIPIRPSLFVVALRLAVSDGGPWRGVAPADWLARFSGRSDDHAGGKPIYVGPRRRRTDRVVEPTERTERTAA